MRVRQADPGRGKFPGLDHLPQSLRAGRRVADDGQLPVPGRRAQGRERLSAHGGLTGHEPLGGPRRTAAELVDPRPGTDSAITEVSGYLLCLGLSLLMLVFLVFIVVPNCANMAIASGGTASCETGGGTYLFGAAFVAITLLAGFRLGTIVFPARTV